CVGRGRLTCHVRIVAAGPRRPLLRSSRGGYVVAGRRTEGGSMQQFDQIETPSNGAPAWVKPAAGAAAGGTVILLAARRRRRKKREAEEKSVRRRAKRLADTVAREAGPTASKTATVVAAKAGPVAKGAQDKVTSGLDKV